MSSLQFLNRVAIVTGGGGALGSAYVRDLAKRGASVIVNDVGSSLSGEKINEISNAEKLVKEINEGGGRAIFSPHDVANESQEIVNLALKNFNRCDILINNAGILRDKSFAKMTKEDWEIIQNVHLNGTFSLTHACWPHFIEQNYGRIITVGSGAGLYGNFGQTNYSSAKMGVIGMMKTLSREGAKFNINVNSIVPVATSRMTESLLTPELASLLTPNSISPLVTYLCHDSSNITGKIFETGGGWISEVKLVRSEGKFFQNNYQAEDVSSNIEDILNFDDGKHMYPSLISDGLVAMMKAKAKSENISISEDSTPATKSTEKKAPNAFGTPIHDLDFNVISSSATTSNLQFPSDEIIEKLTNYLKNNNEQYEALCKDLNSMICFSIEHEDNTKEVKTYLINLKDKNHKDTANDINNKKINLTFTMTTKNFNKLFYKKVTPEYAYMFGNLKIKGAINKALKLKDLISVINV